MIKDGNVQAKEQKVDLLYMLEIRLQSPLVNMIDLKKIFMMYSKTYFCAF